MAINGSGSIAIGGTSSLAQLNIRSSVNGNYLYMDDGSGVLFSISANGSTSGVIQTQGTGFSSWKPMELRANYLQFKPNNSEMMRVNGTGVGIGTDNPTSKLHVGVSGADQASELRLDGTNGSSQVCGFIIDSSGATGNVNFKYNIGGGTPSTRMIMNTAGLKLPASHYLYFEDGNTYLKKGSGNSLMVVTNGGWIQIGPQNSSFCHIMTDRGQFYFNKQVNVAGHVLPYSNNTYSSGLSTNRWTNVYSYGKVILVVRVGIGTDNVRGSLGYPHFMLKEVVLLIAASKDRNNHNSVLQWKSLTSGSEFIFTLIQVITALVS